MATLSSMGRRRAAAIQRIEARGAALGGGQSLSLPTFSRHGPDMLLVFQLEAIADFLDRLPEPETGYQTLSLSQLKSLAKERDLPGVARLRERATLIAALQTADAQAEPGETPSSEGGETTEKETA